MIYFLRSSSPIGNEKHSASIYIGYADDDKFMARINKHMKGRGSHFTKACIQQGNTLMLLAIITGTRTDERNIKNQHCASKLIDQLQRGRIPRCIVGEVLFVQPKCWQDTCVLSLPIFAQSML